MLRTINDYKKNDYYQKDIVLHSDELLYLRLYVHGLNNKQISNFLEINSSEAYLIRARLKLKYGANNWLAIICRAFEHNHLKKIDFVDDAVKNQATLRTEIIFNHYIKRTGNYSNAILKQKILEYYYLCENILRKKPNLKNKVTELEIKFIEGLPYNSGLSDPEILNKLNFKNPKELSIFKRTIFKKFNTENWVTVYKISLRENLICGATNYYNKIVDQEVEECTNKIAAIRNLRLQSYEKKLAIYTELLRFYTNVEFNCLLDFCTNNVREL